MRCALLCLADAGVHVGLADARVHVGLADARVHVGLADARVHVGLTDAGAHVGLTDACLADVCWVGTFAVPLLPHSLAATARLKPTMGALRADGGSA